MVIAGVIVACVVLLVLAFVFPRLSRGPQRGAGMAPGKLGQWLQKPFGKSRKAFNKSGSAGRRGRGKMPL